MSQFPEYRKQEYCLLGCPTVEQQLERTVRQYEATVADIVRRLGGTQDSNAFICPFCKGCFDRAAAASSSCNHPNPSGTQRRPSGNTGNHPGHANSQLDEVLRTMSPGMRQYVVSLEEKYQRKMKETGTDENAALQNLQQRMLNMTNSQPDSPRFSRNSSNIPRPATSTPVCDNIVDVVSVVPGNNGGQTQINLPRSDSSPRKSGGIWAAMRSK